MILPSSHLVQTRDGVGLATDVYLPEVGDTFPTVLTRLPYGKSNPYGTMPDLVPRLLGAGYACVVQDVRGKWDSQGTFDASDIDAEAKDGVDTIQWIQEQSWSNKRIGMWGNSYYGYTCFAAASLKPPGLVCIAPGNQGFDRYHWSYRAGCLRLASEGIWGIGMLGRYSTDTRALDLWHLPLSELANQAGLSCSYFDDVIAHPERDVRYWTVRSRLDEMRSIKIPILQWTGWYDNFMGHMLEEWHWLREADEPSRHQHLLVGPWDHFCSSDSTQSVGLNQIRPGTYDYRWRHFKAFFDRYLKGHENSFGTWGLMHYYSLGSDEWRHTDTWPPHGTTGQTWYLHSTGAARNKLDDGRIDLSRPDVEPPDHYTYDPNDPVAWSVETDPWRLCSAMDDRQAIEMRPDVLTFSSEPLVRPIEITGPIHALLYVQSDAPDTDFMAALVDVFPDGRVNLIQDGVQRASLRGQGEGRQLLRSDEIYAIRIDMWSVSYRVPSGHRLRVEIYSSDFSRYDRNPNTASLFARETHPVPAGQTIHHSSKGPSHVVLPVIER